MHALCPVILGDAHVHLQRLQVFAVRVRVRVAEPLEPRRRRWVRSGEHGDAAPPPLPARPRGAGAALHSASACSFFRKLDFCSCGKQSSQTRTGFRVNRPGTAISCSEQPPHTTRPQCRQ